MKIAGLQKLTLLDYPGKTAATVFTLGCNLRCPFCHNIDLVLPATQKDLPLLSEEDFFSFLNKRKGLLDSVCITGGEPTLQPDLAQFCQQIKEQGFLVKLDTNGSKPEVLQELLQNQLVDYIAMDIKNCPRRYHETAGISFDQNAIKNSNNQSRLLESIEKSIKILFASKIPFEFRTTVVAELHTAASLKETAEWIALLGENQAYSQKDIAWYLQSFVDSDSVLAGQGHFTSWNKEDLIAVLPALQKILPKTELRGV